MRIWPFNKPEAKTTTRYGGGGYRGNDDFITDKPSARGYSVPILPVSEKAAENSSIVAAVAWWGMRNIVQPTPMVKLPNKKGQLEPVPNHLCARLVRKPQALIRPEDRAALNYRRMLRMIFWSLLFDGNGYLQKIRNGSGQVIGLDWVPHDIVTVAARQNYPSVIEEYKVPSPGAGQSTIAKGDMLHFTWGVDIRQPAIGCSPLKSLMRLVMTDNQIAVYSHAILRNPFPGLILTPKDNTNQLQEEDLALIIKQVIEATSGERAGGVAAVNEAMDAHVVGYSPDDMAIRELAKLPEERITAVLGLPAIVAGMGAGLERSTFANMKEANEAAHEQFLVPLWDDIAEVFTEHLLPEFRGSEDMVFMLDYSNVRALQDDQDKVWERAGKAFERNGIDRSRYKTIIGEEPGKEDEGVYSYQLRPAPVMDAAGSGKPPKADAARRAAENA